MTTNRYHKAAKDGLIDLLKEATKKECNTKDEQGMTPTLYAAFHGHLEALRVLCGRGGDPDKSDHFGNTALHLAAAQGHKVVVTFLCNFGANIYAMDIDQRTAQDLAGMNNREEILRYMDAFTGKLEASDKKKVKSMKEKAKKYAEKRIKQFSKRQAKADQNEKLVKKQSSKEYKPSLMSSTLMRMKMKSGSMSNLSNGGQTMSRNSFSAIVAGGTMSKNVNSTVQRKVLASKLRNNNDDDDFKISEIEDGKRSVRHIHGLRRDSEVLYGGVLEDTRRGRLDGVFNEAENVLSSNQSNDGGGTLTRSISQPDFMHELEQSEPLHHQPVVPSSIFVRPGIGSIAFRKSITNTLQAMSFAEAAVEESSIGSARFDDNSESESEEEEENSPIERFLTAWGLSEYLPRFDEQKIDLDTLLMLTESDLKTLNLPLGPHRKLVNAIAERKAALENPREVTDGKL